jgi:putative hemolysin
MEGVSAALTVLALITAGGFFSIFDSALCACRRTRLEKESGKSYKAILKITENPKNILTACRLWSNALKITAVLITGMTVMRFFDTAKTGALYAIPLIAACVIALAIIEALLCIWLPGLISRAAPEKTASLLLLPVRILCFPLMPVILSALKFASLFSAQTNKANITEDELQNELRNVLLEGEKSGIVESKERTMVEGVFYLGDRDVGAFMTHRSEIQCLEVNAPYEEIKQKALEYRNQRCFPVVDGSPDEIVGAADLEDIILDITHSEPKGLRAIMKKAQFIPQTMSALKAFESFKHGDANFLFVMDEYGGLSGVISIRALVEEIVGELSASVQKEEHLVKQEDGSWLADGTLNIDDAAKALSLADLREKDDFHTLAGFILSLAGELPQAGDSFKYQGYCFLVKEMDGNRINKILITVTEN